MVPEAERGEFSLRIILHGRRVCFARKPNCGGCALADFCPSAGQLNPVATICANQDAFLALLGNPSRTLWGLQLRESH